MQRFFDGRILRVELFDKCRHASGLERLRKLDNELAPGNRAGAGIRFGTRLEPRLGRMPAAHRLAAHVRRTAESGDPLFGNRRGISVDVDLQRGPDEHVHAIVPGELAHRSVRVEAAVAPGGKNIRSGGSVSFHADLSPETKPPFDPSRLDRRNHRRQRIGHPILADFPLEPKLLAIGRQQELDRGGVEPDAVVERLDFVFLVDAAERDHRHEDLHIGDRGRIPREERGEVHRIRRLDDQVHLVGRDVDARERVHDLVDLREHDAVGNCRRLDNRWRVLGIRREKQIPLPVGLHRGDERHARRQIHVIPGVKLVVGVDRPDRKFPLGQQLRDRLALRPGIAEVHLADQAFLKQLDVRRQREARHHEVDVAEVFFGERRQLVGQKIRLLLVVALEAENVAGLDDALENLRRGFRGNKLSFRESADAAHAFRLVAAAGVLGSRWHPA